MDGTLRVLAVERLIVVVAIAPDDEKVEPPFKLIFSSGKGDDLRWEVVHKFATFDGLHKQLSSSAPNFIRSEFPRKHTRSTLGIKLSTKAIEERRYQLAVWFKDVLRFYSDLPSDVRTSVLEMIRVPRKLRVCLVSQSELSAGPPGTRDISRMSSLHDDDSECEDCDNEGDLDIRQTFSADVIQRQRLLENVRTGAAQPSMLDSGGSPSSYSGDGTTVTSSHNGRRQKRYSLTYAPRTRCVQDPKPIPISPVFLSLHMQVQFLHQQLTLALRAFHHGGHEKPLAICVSRAQQIQVSGKGCSVIDDILRAASESGLGYVLTAVTFIVWDAHPIDYCNGLLARKLLTASLCVMGYILYTDQRQKFQHNLAIANRAGGTIQQELKGFFSVGPVRRSLQLNPEKLRYPDYSTPYEEPLDRSRPSPRGAMHVSFNNSFGSGFESGISDSLTHPESAIASAHQAAWRSGEASASIGTAANTSNGSLPSALTTPKAAGPSVPATSSSETSASNAAPTAATHPHITLRSVGMAATFGAMMTKTAQKAKSITAITKTASQSSTSGGVGVAGSGAHGEGPTGGIVVAGGTASPLANSSPNKIPAGDAPIPHPSGCDPTHERPAALDPTLTTTTTTITNVTTNTTFTTDKQAPSALNDAHSPVAAVAPAAPAAVVAVEELSEDEQRAVKERKAREAREERDAARRAFEDFEFTGIDPAAKAMSEERRFTHSFKVRGKNYVEDKKKFHPGPAMCKFMLGEVYEVEPKDGDRHDHVVSRGKAKERVAEIAKLPGNPFQLIVNFQIPGDPPVSLVSYFALPPYLAEYNDDHPGKDPELPQFLAMFGQFINLPVSEEERLATWGIVSSKKVVHSSSHSAHNSHNGAAYGADSGGVVDMDGGTERESGDRDSNDGSEHSAHAPTEGSEGSGGGGGGWMKMPSDITWPDPHEKGALPQSDFRNSRFKLIPNVTEGPWVVRAAVRPQPAILGRKVVQRYFRGSNYMEIDVHVGSSIIASQIVGVCRGYAKLFAADVGIVIQGEDPHELPERMLACSSIHKMDVDNREKLD